MPNWCSNHLAVVGDPEALADFAARVSGIDEAGRSTPLLFGAVFPTPPWVKGVGTSFLDLSDFCIPVDFEPDPAWGPNRFSVEIDRRRAPADWYAWRLSKWGTKWELDAETIVSGEPSDRRIVYEFETAWSPPVPWVAAVSACWPTLTFDLWYAEVGMDFAGRMVVADGEYNLDEGWQGGEARDQLRALGWDVYAWWEPEDAECLEDDERLPPLDKNIWVWDESLADLKDPPGSP